VALRSHRPASGRGSSGSAPAGSDVLDGGDCAGRPAIAVLPFDDLSPDPEQAFFADGLAEDLITRLSAWRAFPVIARNSSFQYRGGNLDLKRVSSELGRCRRAAYPARPVSRHAPARHGRLAPGYRRSSQCRPAPGRPRVARGPAAPIA